MFKGMIHTEIKIVIINHEKKKEVQSIYLFMQKKKTKKTVDLVSIFQPLFCFSINNSPKDEIKYFFFFIENMNIWQILLLY